MPCMMRAGLLPTRGQLQDAGASHAISIIRVRVFLAARAHLKASHRLGQQVHLCRAMHGGLRLVRVAGSADEIDNDPADNQCAHHKTTKKAQERGEHHFLHGLPFICIQHCRQLRA